MKKPVDRAMRQWTIATLIAFIVLTSPLTIIGASIVGGMISHGPAYMNAVKIVLEVFYWGDE
jgi:hypothetical protein